MAILTSVRWCLSVVWTCVSLISSDVGHLSMCLLTICMSSLEICLFKFPTHSLIVFCCCCLFVFFVLSCMRSNLYILEINLLSVPLFANILSYSLNFLFTVFMVSFAVWRFLGPTDLFCFYFITLGDGSKRSCCSLCQRIFRLVLF